MHFRLSAAAALAALSQASAQVVGSPWGFAKGVTGGGSATPACPSDAAELKSWLEDSTARVIMICKEFNFIGTEGTTTGHACRYSDCNGSNGGQDTIKDTCDSDETGITATWDNAGIHGIYVKSNKSIVGVGSSGVIRGKGLRLVSGVGNIIVQNVHFTQINPRFVWGGDAIGLEGNDGVWIDHCKFTDVGRQMVVSHYDATRVTLSYNEFDGRTDYAHSCDGDHYWGAMFYGSGDKITLDKNYFHDLAGRSPKIGSTGSQVVQAVNNLYDYNSGHNFDIGSGASVLVEGNRFRNSPTPMTSASSSSGAVVFDVPSSSSASTCSSYLGRNCVQNALTDSGSWPSLTNTGALSALSGYSSYLVTPLAIGDVYGHVRDNYGIGRDGF